jgi:hypothetical protein
MVLGGAAPERTFTIEEMRNKLAMMKIREPANYDEAAWATAAVIYRAFVKYPRLQDVPSEPEYLCDGDGSPVGLEDGKLIYLTRDLFDMIRDLHDEGSPEREAMTGITGFQWGWAVNAARRCLQLPAVQNPALLRVTDTYVRD